MTKSRNLLYDHIKEKDAFVDNFYLKHEEMQESFAKHDNNVLVKSNYSLNQMNDIDKIKYNTAIEELKKERISFVKFVNEMADHVEDIMKEISAKHDNKNDNITIEDFIILDKDRQTVVNLFKDIIKKIKDKIITIEEKSKNVYEFIRPEYLFQIKNLEKVATNLKIWIENENKSYKNFISKHKIKQRVIEKVEQKEFYNNQIITKNSHLSLISLKMNLLMS